uniref:Chromatin remodeling complex ATPase n=1 Tax=Myoviridae sp. ctRPH1 TaxID=2826650 RepID=A0A8S5MAG7_9CAUD|nr:MAG TPA: Chromatin remodeling complex ATPase [Myoviridae sp. ctRPH1]
MGTGKTVTTLTAIDALLYDWLEDGPVLVVAPKRVAENTWSKETAKWEHLQHLRVVKIMGTVKQRQKALLRNADIYVVNRENVVWLVEAVGAHWPFPIVVIDELSSFKSAQAKRWKALRKVRGRIRRIIGLTGTPRPNGLEDLYPEIYLLDQGARLGRTLSAFRARYLLPEKMSGHIVYSYRPRDGAEAEVYDRLSDICMSIRKDDVLQLPGQIYEDIVLPAPPALLKQYKQFERDKVLECLDADGEIVAGTQAALTNKLLQFANGAIYDQDGQAHRLHDIKLDALEELVEEAGGDPVLVLYAYKHDAERIRERIACRALDTPDDIDAWNRGEIPVALAHPASIGHGLNLQDGGHIIIWYGLTWSLELYQQANERLNRPGQKNICRIYHLILQGTHDERVLKALNSKDKGQAAAIEALRLEILEER